MAKKEAPPIYAIKVGDKLVGEMQLDRDMIAAMPSGVRIKIDLRTGRVPSKLRFWWAFLNDVVKSTECAPTVEALNDVVKLNTGFVTPVAVKGFTVMVPRSISYASMSEEDFDAYVKSGLRFIAQTFGITPEDIEDAA